MGGESGEDGETKGRKGRGAGQGAPVDHMKVGFRLRGRWGPREGSERLWLPGGERTVGRGRGQVHCCISPEGPGAIMVCPGCGSWWEGEGGQILFFALFHLIFLLILYYGGTLA